jgi:phosphatidate cytidylyltransferase
MSEGQKRLLVAAVGIPLFLTPAVVGGNWLWLLIILIQFRAVVEWSRLSTILGARPSRIWTFLLTLGIDAVFYFDFQPYSVAALAALLPIALCFEALRVHHKPYRDIASVALFVVYVGLPIALWHWLAQVPLTDAPARLNMLLLLVATTWICDSAAYYGGRQFGKHPLYVAASPNKTWEGAICGFAASALVLPALGLSIQVSFQPLDYVVLPFVVGVVGQTGDLLESLMKREAGVKDTSALLPGHGGVLDRFDSLLVSTPAFFAYLLVTSR